MFDPRQYNLYKGKRGRGVEVWKGAVFSYCVSPLVLAEYVKKKKKSLHSVPVWEQPSSEGLHLEQGCACKGSWVTSQTETECTSARKGQMSPTSHNMRLSVVPSISFFVSPSSLVYLFSLLLWRDNVIHNPLDYRQLNYPPPVCPFSPLGWRFKKQLTSSRLGTFSQERAQR